MYFGAGLDPFHRRADAIIALAMMLAVGWAGCALFQVPEEPPAPSIAEPVWSDEEIEDHLEFLNSGEAAERTTGTQGYARAAEYVAARMDEFRLQPAIAGDFRVVYSTSINYPLTAGLRAVAGTDSVLFYPGIDFLADGRSDSGLASVRTLVVTDDTTGVARAPASPFAVLFRDGGVDMSTLLRWRSAGASLALSVQTLAPQFFGVRVPGLVALQVSPNALRRFLPVQAASADYGERFSLEQRIVARVRTDYRTNAGAINVLGYVAGKHPVRSRELVLVCADLDAVSDFAGVRTLDFENFAVGTAALLEVARNLSYVARRWSLPERSVLMAVWSGSQLGHEGLRYFLDDPTWALDHITSVIYLGLTAEEEPAVRKLLADKGLQLHVIPRSAKPLFDQPLLLLPDPAVHRLARESRRASGGDVPDEMAVPDLDVVIDSAIVQARSMADAAYERMLVASTSSNPFAPVREDTLKRPSGASGETL